MIIVDRKGWIVAIIGGLIGASLAWLVLYIAR